MVMSASVDEQPGAVTHAISVVIPVYRGHETLGPLIEAIRPFTEQGTTPNGYPFRVSEVILVFDHGPDRSDETMRRLQDENSFVRTIWLSRNFGQHAASLAGMASAGGDWIATLDEDGQHDPIFLPALLDTAMREQAALVYAKPTNPAPHSWVRNMTSRASKWVLTKLLAGPRALDYHSYRFVLGEIGRSVAAYAGSNVYLDVALGWVAGDPATCAIELRSEGRDQSGYSTRRLLSHFWRMVLTSGTRGLRVVTAIGLAFAIIAVGLTIWVIVSRIIGTSVPEGWASTIIVVLFSGGAVLFALGVIAEYLGVAVNMALGRPAYLIVSDRRNGPLGRRPL